MKYIRLYEERLKDFEIITNSDTNFLIKELKEEIKKEDYNLDYIRDLVVYGNFDIDTLLSYDIEGWTFLTKAAFLNKADIVKVLLEEGAYPNLKNSSGFTALIWASREGHAQVVQALLSHPNIDPNLQNRWGRTALIWATILNCSQAVLELLKHPSIDLNLKDDNGLTAYNYALMLKDPQIAQAILNHPKFK
jgi:ankyrin repeat protein